MKRWKLNISPWYSLGLAAVLIALALTVATGTAWARYRTDVNGDLTFNARRLVSVYLGKVALSKTEEGTDEEVFVQTDAGSWQKNQNGQLQLDFAVANGISATEYETADQQVRVRLIGSLGLQSDAQEVTLKLYVPKEDALPEDSEDTTQDGTEDTPQEDPEDNTQDGTEDTTQDGTEDTTQGENGDTSQNDPEDTTQGETGDTPQENPENTPQVAAEDATEDTSEDTTEDDLQDESQDNPEDDQQDPSTDGTQDDSQGDQQEEPQDSLQDAPLNNLQKFDEITAKAVRIETGSPLYTTFGEGWVFYFMDEEGKELTWKLKGDAFSYLKMSLTLEGGTTAEAGLLQIQVSSEYIQE